MSVSIEPFRSRELPGVPNERPLLISQDFPVVIVLVGNTILAFDAARSLMPLWSQTSGSNLKGALAIAGYVCCVSGKDLYRFSLIDGKPPKWHRTPVFGAELLPPAQLGDSIFVVDATGTSYLIDKETGDSRSQRIVEGPAVQPPVIAGQTLIYAVDDRLIGARTDNLGQRWQFDFHEYGAIAGLVANAQFVIAAFCNNEHACLVRFDANDATDGNPQKILTRAGDFSGGDMSLQWLASGESWASFGRRNLTKYDGDDLRLFTAVTPLSDPHNYGYGNLDRSFAQLSRLNPDAPVYSTFHSKLFGEQSTLDKSALLVASGTTVQVRRGDRQASLMNDYEIPNRITAAPIVDGDRVFICGTDSQGRSSIDEYKDVTSRATFTGSVIACQKNITNPIAVAIGTEPDGSFRAYVPADGSLTVIDLSQDPPKFSSVAVPEIGTESQGVAVAVSGEVYIAATKANRLVVFDPATNRVTHTFDIEKPRGIVLFEDFHAYIWTGGRQHHGLVPVPPVPVKLLTYVGRVACVTDWSDDSARFAVCFVETDVETVGGAGKKPSGAVAWTGTSMFIANQFSGTVSLAQWNGELWNNSDYVKTGARPFDLALSSDGEKLYVTNRWDAGSGLVDNSVRVIATGEEVAGQVIAILETSTSSITFGVAVVPGTRWLLVASQDAGEVRVIDTALYEVLTTPIKVEAAPQQIAVTPDGKLAVVANYQGQSVSIIRILEGE